MRGSWFQGRPLDWNPDKQAIEQERQKWVYEHIGIMNEAITDLCVDPATQYEAHRQEYEKTGDLNQLRLMLEYVQ